MTEEIAIEYGRIFDFEGLVTLTLNRVILHTVRTHVRMYVRNVTHGHTVI